VTNLAAVLDEHLRCEFELGDAEATTETMSADPYLHHEPMLTGGRGREKVHRFYRDFFIPSWPADTETISISRTVSADHLVDELVVGFTHHRGMAFMLPSIEPTGRCVELPHAVIVGFENGKIHHEHVYWDQASFLVQIGLLDTDRLPATGAEQASRLLELGRSAAT
jgi:carboxymethylenebutenolidase